MNTTRLFIAEKKQSLPVLIVDKGGRLGHMQEKLGHMLAAKISTSMITVLVSESEPVSEQVVFIPYKNRMPAIPDSLFSHIFLFYSGDKDLLGLLPSFCKKARESRGKCFLLISIREVDEQVLSALKHHEHQLSVLFYGDLFSDSEFFPGPITAMLEQAKIEQQVSLSGEGLSLWYPVEISDFLDIVISIGFGNQTTDHELCLFPRHAYTELSLFRLLLQKNPLLKVRFQKEKNTTHSAFIPPTGQYLLPASYQVEKKLVKTFSLLSETAKAKKNILRGRDKRWKNPGTFIFVCFLAFLCLPFLLSVIFGFFGIFLLQAAERQSVNINASEELIQASQIFFAISDQAKKIDLLGNFVPISQSGRLSELSSAGREIASILDDEVQIKILLAGIATGTNSNPITDSEGVLGLIRHGLLTGRSLLLEGVLPNALSEKVEGIDRSLSPAMGIADSLPNLLGFQGEKKYLVLFQNNMELRPGGGFIGSYAILEVKNGKVISLKVYDVYSADGQLKGHIEPPFALRRYVGVKHWFLRDSNFSVDFPEDAKDAASFLSLETGEKVDGVIAIDTSFLRSLLVLTGPITLPDYHATITPDNFFLLTEEHSEQNFFPGSTQKTDFLHAFYTALLLRFSSALSMQETIKTIVSQAEQKHLMFVSADTGIEQLFTVNDFSGSLWDNRINDGKNINDFLAVIDANVGLNKANYYVHRSITQNITIDKKLNTSGQASVTWKNTSTNTSEFGGDYKNYVRFVLPVGTQITKIEVDGQERKTTPAITDSAVYESKTFTPPQELEIEQTSDGGKSVFAFLVVVPVGQTRKVSVFYNLPPFVSQDSQDFLYNLTVYKQPGEETEQYSLSFTYPDFLQIVNKSPGFMPSGNGESFLSELDTDQNVQIMLSRK